MNWTKLVEDQIKEAMARGEFANLPGAGKPLDLAENPYTPEGLRLAYKILKDSGYAPLWLELHKETKAATRPWPMPWAASSAASSTMVLPVT